MELSTVRLEIPENGNLILGQTHFIKKGAVEWARNNGKLPYRAILIEYKD